MCELGQKAILSLPSCTPQAVVDLSTLQDPSTRELPQRVCVVHLRPRKKILWDTAFDLGSRTNSTIYIISGSGGGLREYRWVTGAGDRLTGCLYSVFGREID